MGGNKQASVESRLDQLETALEEQRNTIQRQQAKIERQEEIIAQFSTESWPGLDRRQLLQAGGVLGLLGLGASAASGSVSAAGQIGTESRPLETVYSEQLRAPEGGSVGTESNPMEAVHTSQVHTPGGGTVGTDSDPVETLHAERLSTPSGQLTIDQDVSISGDVTYDGQLHPTNPVIFRAYDSNGGCYSDGDRIQFDTTTIDPGNNFDTNNHEFVAPVDGYYRIFHMLQWDNETTSYTRVMVNGTQRGRAIGRVTDTVSWNHINDVTVLDLEAGDSVWIEDRDDTCIYAGTSRYRHNEFHGELIARS